MKNYAEFLEAKRVRPVAAGKAPGPCHESLYPFQVAVVEWAVRLGRAAVVADCGLGKTRIQLEWARQMGERTLILAPLAVAGQTAKEGAAIGVPVTICRTQSDVREGVNITNYEMLEHFDSASFGAVVLDESSILKNMMGRTRQRLTEAFSRTPYRLCCTATPAPNDHTELGNHAEFLGVLKNIEMLARFFINDGFRSGEFRLKRHAETEFWAWVHSWAVSLERPSDMGAFDDTEFVLPPISMHEHTMETDHDPSTTGTLFRMPTMSATTMHAEMKRTADLRARRVADLVAGDDRAWVVWCHTNYEADALMAAIPDAVEVRGNDSADDKESRLLGFSEGRFRVLVTKPSIAGFGMNWQHCPNAAFVGLSYSYEAFYQAIRRIWRFGQRSPVAVHVVTADTEGNILEAIHRKDEENRTLRSRMVRAMREIQRGPAAPKERRVIHHESKRWDLYRGDCVDVVGGLDESSVGLSVFSPPFADLFVYSDEEADMGNNDRKHFQEHFRFLIRELWRVTIPGRHVCVHCTDLTRNQWKEGVTGLYDFPGEIIRSFEAEGWTYHSRATIWKSPVTEMQRTKSNGLLYKQLRKNSAASRVGMPDYLLAFRKWPRGMSSGDFSDPVEHTPEDFPLDQWQEWASPVWMTVNQTNVLQFRGAKGDKDERHICPLQLDVIERCVALWSNPGDLMLSPFAGIGSEGYVAVKMGRRFVGVELKPEYFDVAVRHLHKAEQESLGDLFAAGGES